MDVDHATAALSLDIEDGIPLGEEAQATLLAEEEVPRSLSLLATARHPDAQGEGAHRPLSPRARGQPMWAPPSENPPAGRMPADRVTPTSARAADADGGPFEEAPLGRGAALGAPSRHAGAGGAPRAGGGGQAYLCAPATKKNRHHVEDQICATRIPNCTQDGAHHMCIHGWGAVVVPARARNLEARFSLRFLKYHTTTPAACGQKRALPSGLGNVGEEGGGGACHSACALRSREAGRRGEIRVSLGEGREAPRDEAGPCGTRPQCCRAGAWGRAPRACGRASRPGPRGELGARTEAARGVLGPAAHARTMRRTT